MAKFFIDRPIFAIVIAILIMVAGALSIFTLPIEQYPPIAPPSVQISTSYPGASATTVQDTVVQVIEQQMSGLDNLLYMSSISDDTGQSTTTLTFATGTDPNIAQVQVQNKLQLATPNLPQQVQQSGIRVTKSTNSFLMVIGFVSADNSMNKFDIANYVVSNVQDPISRVNGVGNLSIFGSQYAMRIWLDPSKLNSFALAPLDVTAALLAQNVQISGGQLGGTPAVQNQQLTAAITESTLLRTPEQFGAILLKVMPDGSQVRLRDVAQPDLRAIGHDLQQDGAELLGGAQQGRFGDCRRQLLVLHCRRAAELAAGDLHVLRLQRRGHVERRKGEAVELARVEPDSHRVLRAEDAQVADAVDPADRVLDVRHDVVGDVELVHAVVGRDEADDHQERVGRLGDADAGLLDLLRQVRRGELQLVLHLHLRDVRVGAGRKGERRGRLPGVVADRGHVEQVVQAAHLLLDDLHYRVLHRGRRGA